MRTRIDDVDDIDWDAVMPYIDALGEQMREAKEESRSSALAIDRAAFTLGVRQLQRRLVEKSVQAATEDTPHECCVEDAHGAVLCLRGRNRADVERQLAEMKRTLPRWFGRECKVRPIKKSMPCGCRGNACACAI